MTDARHREDVLAWDLVEQVRDQLTDQERTIAFVHLGIGDYPPVFRCVLEVVARERVTLPPETVALLRAWLEQYHRHQEFESILVRAVGEASSEGVVSSQ